MLIHIKDVTQKGIDHQGAEHERKESIAADINAQQTLIGSIRASASRFGCRNGKHLDMIKS